MGNIKITMTIDSKAHPELIRELEGMLPRLRSERVRTLALMGIQQKMMLQGGAGKTLMQNTEELNQPFAPKSKGLGSQIKNDSGFSM